MYLMQDAGLFLPSAKLHRDLSCAVQTAYNIEYIFTENGDVLVYLLENRCETSFFQRAI